MVTDNCGFIHRFSFRENHLASRTYHILKTNCIKKSTLLCHIHILFFLYLDFLRCIDYVLQFAFLCNIYKYEF